MSDQIILEFIGDPSGLKPAEEALKGLTKTSQETVDAFAKANAAAKTFAESAKEASTALKGIEDAAGKSVKAISALTQSISGGAVKAIITDFKNWSAEIVTLTGQKEKLQAKLSAVQGEMAKANTEVKNATKEYNSLAREARTTESEITKNSNALIYQATQADKAASKNETLKTQLEEVKGKMAAMNGTSEEGSKKYNALAGQAQKLEDQIAKNNKSYIDHTAKTIELGAKNVELTGHLSGVETKMAEANTKIEEGKEKYSSLSKEAKTLQTGINDTNTAIAESSKEFSHHSKAASDSTKSMASLMANTKKLISAMGEIGAAVAHASGNDKEANDIRQKTAEVLSVITTAQELATTAQEGMTAATEIGTVAAGALDVALGPITLVVLAIAAAVGAAVAEFKLFSYIADKVKPIGDAVKFVEDKVRDLISIMTLGFVDSSAVHQHKEDIKAIGDEHEKNSESLKKQISLLEAQGASSERIAEQKKEQLEEEKKSLEAQIELEQDDTKQKELQNKLDENAIGLIKNKKELQDAHLDAMKAEGASELEILQEKKNQNIEAIKLNDAAIQKLKTDIQDLNIHGQISAEMYRELDALEHQGKVLATNNKEYTAAIADQHKQAADNAKQHTIEALQKKKELVDAELAAAKSGSKQELDAKIKDLDAAAKIEIAQADGNKELIGFINAKLIKDKEAAENAYLLKSIQAEKTALEARLTTVKKNSTEELNIKNQLYQKETELINANQNLSIDEQTKALYELAQRKQKADEDAAKEAKAKDDQAIKEKMDTANAAIDQITAKQKEAADKEIKSIQEQLTNTKLSFAQRGELIHQLHSLIDTELKQEKKDIDDKYALDLKAAKDNDEALKKLAEKHAEDIKAIDKKIEENDKQEIVKEDANTAASNKDKLDKAKQVGKALIDMAKQVADAIFENQKQKRDNELKSQLDNLNEQKDAELLNTTLTASQKNAIEKKYRIEEAQAKEKAWKADQKAKAEQAIINGLLAFSMSMAQQGYPAGLVTGLLALASAGVQAGIILSKTPPKFAKGVVALDGPGTGTSDSIAAYLSKGESVITAKATKQYAPLLEAMNAGTFSEYMPIPQMPDVSHQLAAVMSSSGTIGSEKIDYEKLGAAFARKVNLKQLNINIDEKGFSKSILSKGSRVEYYNDKLKF